MKNKLKNDPRLFTKGLVDKDGVKTYFIKNSKEKHGHVKIGKTTNIRSRMRSLQTATPGELELLAFIPGDYEAAAHEALSDVRVHGEWFKFDCEVENFINRHCLILPEFDALECESVADYRLIRLYIAHDETERYGVRLPVYMPAPKNVIVHGSPTNSHLSDLEVDGRLLMTDIFTGEIELVPTSRIASKHSGFNLDI